MSEVIVARSPGQRASLDADADQLERLVRARGAYGHVGVRAARGHLLIENRSAQAEPDVVARSTPLGAGSYGLSFSIHTGRWCRGTDARLGVPRRRRRGDRRTARTVPRSLRSRVSVIGRTSRTLH